MTSIQIGDAYREIYYPAETCFLTPFYLRNLDVFNYLKVLKSMFKKI